MKTPVKAETLKVGDKICYRDDVTVTTIGTFTHIESCGRYYFTWENGDSLFLSPPTLSDINRCWMHSNTDVVITEDMVRKILDIYVGDCPNHHDDKAVDYIMRKLYPEKDPEYAEYMRLKEKFEK